MGQKKSASRHEGCVAVVSGSGRSNELNSFGGGVRSTAVLTVGLFRRRPKVTGLKATTAFRMPSIDPRLGVGPSPGGCGRGKGNDAVAHECLVGLDRHGSIFQARYAA